MRKLTFNRKAVSLVLALTLASSLSAAVSAQAIAITTNDFVPLAAVCFRAVCQWRGW